MGRTTHQPSVWCSKHYFFKLFIFCKIMKNKNMNLNDFCKEFCKKLWKKIMLGTSDTWLMSHSSHRPNKPEYYMEDCRISRENDENMGCAGASGNRQILVYLSLPNMGSPYTISYNIHNVNNNKHSYLLPRPRRPVSWLWAIIWGLLVTWCEHPDW